MSKRCVVLVVRGPLDKTACTVWEHEVPILEQIHGEGNVITLDANQLWEDDTAVVIRGTTQLIDPKSQNLRVQKDEKGKECVEITSMEDGKPRTYRKEIDRIPLRDLMPQITGIGAQFDGHVDDEYARLASCYGMHPEIRQPMVENVYGPLRSGRFAAQVMGLPA